jgi:hypothetical protein
MRNAQHSRCAPHLARSLEQDTPLLAIQTTKRFVQNDQADATPCQRSSKAHALAFTARHEAPTLPQRGLQAIREAVEHITQTRLRQSHSNQGSRSICPAIAQIVK